MYRPTRWQRQATRAEVRPRGARSLSLPTSVWLPVTLLLMTAVAFAAHELAHHFLGALVCGGFGSATFTRYETLHGCATWAARCTELIGPLVSLTLAYAGAWLAWRRRSTFGWLLIFASYFHLRFLPPLLGGGNDELDLARHTDFLHGSAHAIAAGLFLIALPPLIAGYRVLAGRWRGLVFAVAWLLPLLVLAGSDPFDALFTGKHAVAAGLAQASVLNVPVIVLLVDLILAMQLALAWLRMHSQAARTR